MKKGGKNWTSGEREGEREVAQESKVARSLGRETERKKERLAATYVMIISNDPSLLSCTYLPVSKRPTPRPSVRSSVRPYTTVRPSVRPPSERCLFISFTPDKKEPRGQQLPVRIPQVSNGRSIKFSKGFWKQIGLEKNTRSANSRSWTGKGRRKSGNVIPASLQ